MVSFDKRDSTSSRQSIPDFSDFKKISIKGKRIGIPKEYMIDGLNSDIKKIWDSGISWFKSEGAEILEISLPHTKSALPTYYIIAPAEASANLARYDGIRYGFRHNADDLNDLYQKLEGLDLEKKLKED